MMETVTGDQCVVYSKRGYILYVDPHLLLAKITGGCHSPPPPRKEWWRGSTTQDSCQAGIGWHLCKLLVLSPGMDPGYSRLPQSKIIMHYEWAYC
jgi:hypothetical protein